MPPTDRACCSALAHWTHLARDHGVGTRSRVLCTSQTPQTIAPETPKVVRLSVEPKVCLHPWSDVDRGLVQVDPEARCEQKYYVTSTVLDDTIAMPAREGVERPRHLRATSMSQHETARQTRPVHETNLCA